MFGTREAVAQALAACGWKINTIGQVRDPILSSRKIRVDLGLDIPYHGLPVALAARTYYKEEGRKFYRQPLVLVLGAALLVASSVVAAPITVMVGDADGLGLGCSDNGTCIWPGPSGSNFDGRDAAATTAVNGAQITDVCRAIFPGSGPNTRTTASVTLPFPGILVSGTLAVALGDFQATTFGPMKVHYHGLPEHGAFEDGFQATKVRDCTRSAAEVAAANLAPQVVVTLGRTARAKMMGTQRRHTLHGHVAQGPPPPQVHRDRRQSECQCAPHRAAACPRSARYSPRERRRSCLSGRAGTGGRSGWARDLLCVARPCRW